MSANCKLIDTVPRCVSLVQTLTGTCHNCFLTFKLTTTQILCLPKVRFKTITAKT